MTCHQTKDKSPDLARWWTGNARLVFSPEVTSGIWEQQPLSPGGSSPSSTLPWVQQTCQTSGTCTTQGQGQIWEVKRCFLLPENLLLSSVSTIQAASTCCLDFGSPAQDLLIRERASLQLSACGRKSNTNGSAGNKGISKSAH